MRYTIDKQERYVVIEPLREVIDGVAANYLKGEFMLRNTAGQRNIVLDLNMVKEITEEGVRMGLLAHRFSSWWRFYSCQCASSSFSDFTNSAFGSAFYHIKEFD